MHININQNNNQINTNKRSKLGFSQEQARTDFSAALTNYLSFYDKNTSTSKLREVFQSFIQKPSIKPYKEIQTFKVPYIGECKIYQLNNGHKVVVIPKEGATVVDTFVKVGAFNEPEEQSGISHLLEHLIYKKAGNFSNLGAKHNAETDTHYTHYYFKLPIAQNGDFEKLLDMHSNMLLKPDFSESMLEKEKNIVISELHTKDGDDILKAQDLALKNLFGINSNRAMVLGTKQSINNLTKQSIVEHYDKWYTPDNMTTVIVGNFKPEDAIKSFNKYFGGAKSKSVRADEKHCINFKNPLQKTVKTDIKSNYTFLPKIFINFIGPRNDDIKGSIATFAMLLAVTNDKNFEMSLNEVSPNLSDPQVIRFVTDVKNQDKALNNIEKYLAEKANNPISDKEMEAIKINLKRKLAEFSQNSLALANFAGDSIVNNGSISGFCDRKQIIESLTPADIQEAAKKYLDINKASIVVLNTQYSPTNTENKINLSQNNEKIGFKGAEFKYNLEHVKQKRLKNNLNLVIDSSPGIAETHISLRLNLNKVPIQKSAVSTILGFMITEAIPKNYSKKQFDDLIKTNGIKIKPDGSQNSVVVRASCLPEKTLTSINLIKDLVYKPNLTQENLEKTKEFLKKTFTPLSKDITSLVDYEIDKDIPPKLVVSRALKEIDKVSLEEVKNAYNDILLNSYGNLILTIPEDELKNIEGELINSLETLPVSLQKKENKNGTELFNLMGSLPIVKIKVFTQENKYNQQAKIKQTFKLIENGSLKESICLNLLSKILGDENTRKSRLFQDLREDKTITYKTKAEYSSEGKIGRLSLEAEINTANNPEGISIVFKSFKNAINSLTVNPISQEELNTAKIMLKNDYLENIETSEGRNELLENSIDSEQGINYINEVLKEIDGITAQDIQNCARKFLTKSSIYSVYAPKEAIDYNKNYFASFGKI